MHNKTDRFGIPLKPQTTDLVGPTTYTVICKTHLENCAPFLSTAALGPSFFKKSFCNTFYSLPDDTKSKKLGCSPSYKSARSFRYETDSPGPAARNLKFVKCPTQADRITEGKKPKKLYVCRVPYTLVGAGPSIPTKLNANGYKVGPYGDVTPIPPNDEDNTLGPACYDVVKKSSYESKYRGIDWSFGKTKREFYNFDPYIPGPAEYDVKMPSCRRDEKDEEYREMARLLSFVPRFLDKQEMIARNNNFPSPGEYDLNKGDICKPCPPLEPVPFFTKSKRFQTQDMNTPAPTAYFQKPPMVCVFKERAVPFGVGSSRFSNKFMNQTPGPAEYEIKSALSQKVARDVGYKPPFGKSAPRVTIEFFKDILNTPSPQIYTIEKEKSCKLYQTSMFKSKIARFPKKCKTLNGAPGRYEDMESFKAMKNKKSHNAFHISFNSKSPKKDLYDTKPSSNLSSASYDLSKGLDGKGCNIPKSPRWIDPKDNFPGPGSYLIHPSYRIGTYNAFKTHNLHMKEDVLKMTLRLHPKSTWAKWAIELKKCKKLRWFQNEGKNFVHCHKDLLAYTTEYRK